MLLHHGSTLAVVLSLQALALRLRCVYLHT
jgi:hypothetical protein